MSLQTSPNAPHLNYESLMDSFDSLEDPRRHASCAYPLQELLLTAFCAIASAADDWVDVALWGRESLDWLRRFLPFANGIASHDTFSRVFKLIDSNKFEACFATWMRLLCPSLQEHIVHIDGKSVRGSHNGDQPMTHLVSAWDSACGVTLGQIKTADKSNEITAIPQLLEALNIRGATVTIDAMGCQREIARTLHNQQADYILAVKDNQPKLAQAVQAAFDSPELALAQDIQINKDHGRIETRRCVVSAQLSTLSQALRDAWPGICTLVMIESQRELLTGKRTVTTERRYYISSCQMDAKQFNEVIRRHWSIENSCHWVLDVAFREDDSRIRVGDGAQNFAILRRMALNLINQSKTIKASKKSKRNLAAWSKTRLQELLGLQQLP